MSAVPSAATALSTMVAAAKRTGQRRDADDLVAGQSRSARAADDRAGRDPAMRLSR